MKCPECHDTRLQVDRTVSAGPSGKCQELSCRSCGTRFTGITLLVVKIDDEGGRNPYGWGARAVARRLKGWLGSD